MAIPCDIPAMKTGAYGRYFATSALTRDVVLLVLYAVTKLDIYIIVRQCVEIKVFATTPE